MSRPLVALDATPISERLKGAGRVLKNLLSTLPAVEPGLRWLAFVTEAGAAVVGEPRAGVELVVVRPGRAVSWELLGLRREARRRGVDLVFTTREIVGPGGPPTVMHVFEPPRYRLDGLGAKLLAEPKATLKDVFLHATFAGSVRRAAAVTAGSATTAEWLRSRYGVEAEVVYPGIDPVFLEDQEPAARGAYLLHPASGDARENTDLVLAGFAAWGPPDIRLRLVGAPDAIKAGLRARAAELGIADRLDVLGWVSDPELRRLYREALGVVQLSRYEAFAGLPALEAMALGTPVLALAAPGATEALEGAAVLVDTGEPAAVAAQMRRLAEDESLRERLGATGRERARRLTWDEAARTVAEVLRRVLAA